MDAKEKKELLKKYAQEQKAAFINSLPFSKAHFDALFDFLDEKLQAHGCDDTLLFTTEFLTANDLPVQESLVWMRENGGYCDCEVLANVEDKIANLE